MIIPSRNVPKINKLVVLITLNKKFLSTDIFLPGVILTNMESEKRAILVVGGTGYIGSHTVVQLLEEGQQVVIIDDLSNSSRQVLERIHTIAKPAQILAFHEIDMTDAAGMDAVCSQYKDKISCVIHFAGKKAVGESVSDPLKYYHNNLTGTINLLRCMKSIGCQAYKLSNF